MSLLSLLIALAAEKSLSSSLWRFDYYYQKYASLFQRITTFSILKGSTFSYTIFLLLPVVIVYGGLSFIDDGLLHIIISTSVLIICFGCLTTRHSYKQFLHAASRHQQTTSELFHKQLLQDKNLPPMSFGQALVWLNYRYYIAIMLLFTVFGAPGVVFYRLLTTVIEQQNGCSLDQSAIKSNNDNLDAIEHLYSRKENTINEDDKDNVPVVSPGCKNYHSLLFFIDWLPVRIISFGYVFVGHFAKALPMWLESFFDGKKPTHKVLTDVAQKSEDIVIDNDDCTAEPRLLVRLSKRNGLLLLATIAALTLFGVIR